MTEQIREPEWPRERSLSRYKELTGIDIPAILKDGGTWVDIGPGETMNAMNPLVGQDRLSLYAIGPHIRDVPKGIKFELGLVPDDQNFLNSLRGKAKLVTDIYGALSYAQNPLRVLIYGAMLIHGNGLFVGFTELLRIGDLATWSRITNFFRSELNLGVSFQTVGVIGDASGIFSACLRVVVSGDVPTSENFFDVCARADAIVGRMSKAEALWVSEDGLATIWRTKYLT